MKKLKGLFKLVRLAEDPEYLKNKLLDNLSFTTLMYSISAPIGSSLWVWDIITDPIGAQNTIGLRLCFLFLFAGSFLFRFIKNKPVLVLTSILLLLFSQVLLILILNHLDTGMIYGIGGFMLFMFMALLLLQGFSLRINLIYTCIATISPHFFALMGLAEGFQHNHYAVLLWPTAVMVMLAQVLFSQKDYHKYKSEMALEIASNTDPMTGVSNRRHFMPLLRKEIIRNDRFKHQISLLMIDIDHFKKINDTYGHQTGDLAICSLVNICLKSIRQSDIMARYGGEEFAILLPETGMTEAIKIAERIRLAMEICHLESLCGKKFYITVSIGAAEQPSGDVSEESILRISDEALYQAKKSGRNRVEKMG